MNKDNNKELIWGEIKVQDLLKKLYKDNDALVIFNKYIVFYKDKKCGLCTHSGEEIFAREYDEIFV